MPPVLQLRDVVLTLGGAPLLEGAELSISPGERIALVGRNGSGKSTLLRIAAGQLTPDRGTRFAQPSARLAYLPQEPDLAGYATTLDYVLAGLGEQDNEYSARAMMAELGLELASKPADLSGGEARRAALVRVLAPEPEILLLDEPTNHLDLLAIEWLEAHLAQSRSALALISHDRRLLADLTRATVWLDRGATHRLDQGFGAFEAWRDKKLEEEEVERQKLDRRIASEEHWMRYGVTARRKRNMRRVGELANLRRERREARRAGGLVEYAGAGVEDVGRPGDRGREDQQGLRGKADRQGFFAPRDARRQDRRRRRQRRRQNDDDQSPDRRASARRRNGADRIERRDGEPRPEADIARARDHPGRRLDRRGQRLRHHQRRAPARDRLHEGLSVRAGAGADADRQAVGRRARAPDARAERSSAPSNLMVLDEPTNDLDIETLDLLQELLGEYQGTILIVSHDRDFLDRVATSVIVSEGDGAWVEYAGGYSDMVAQRGYGLAGPSVALASAKPERTAAREPDRAPARRKLGFNEKRTLEQLPDRMDALRKELERLETELADGELALREPAAFQASMARYGAVREALDKAEDEWLALEMLREDLES